MHEKPKLQCTRDHAIFEMHANNRPLHDNPRLLDSMQKNGFMPSRAIQCVRNSSGKLTVISGHHRLDCAKRLGLPVWYIIDESNTELFGSEATAISWSVTDFAKARAAAGNEDCAKVLEFQKKHKLPFGAAASLVGGESAGSTNKSHGIKSGSFKVGRDMSHAHAVVAITDKCLELGISWATSTAFVNAISRVLRVPEFNASVFIRRLGLYGGQMQRRTTVDACLGEIESLYNYGAKERRLPLAFRAREVGRARQASFGK